jgi:transposase-like protein
MSNRRGEYKERFWRSQVALWRKSGASVRVFCEEHGLSEPSFYAWRRTLAARDTTAVRLVPVQVMPEAPSAPNTEDSATALELILGAGRRLRIAPGFDGPTLQRLLALLEEGRP